MTIHFLQNEIRPLDFFYGYEVWILQNEVIY